MKTAYQSLVTLLLAAGGVGTVRAALPPGANLLPYEIHNTSTGKEYCQMCAYAERPATIAAYGNLHDEGFWADLQKLQKLQTEHRNFGFFGQVLDSHDSDAIQAEAKKHSVTFPLVYAVDANWEKTYQVKGVSRTVYYSNDFKIAWSGVGLGDKDAAVIAEKIKADPKS